MNKSAEQVAATIAKKATLIILAELPEPSCHNAKEAWRWKVEQAKKLAAAKIWPENAGVTVNITP